jgi:hypothetical protein
MQTAVRHIGKVASVSVHVQSSCDEQREHNTGRIVIGNRDFDLPSSTNQLYVYHIDADGELKRSNGTLDRDSNLLFSATEDMSGSLIAVVHFGGGVPMSTANHRALHRLGSNVFTLFEPTVPPRQTRHHHHHHHHHHHGQDQGQDQDYNDQHVFAAPDGWTYVFVRSQGQVLLDSHQLSCGAQSWSGHIQTRAAKVDQCPSSGFARRPCNQFPCPVDCKLGPWSDWSVCTSKCGGGTQFQRREVLQMNNAFGRACADTVHWQSCNEHPCPRDCNVTAWSEWSQCSRICGGGTQYRTRSINIKASWGGTACPSSIYEELECNSSPCLQPTPTPVVCDEGDSCAPTPAPPTPPPCQNTCPWFHAEPNLGQYRRFDSSKVSATEFSILFEAKACGNALIAFMPQQREQVYFRLALVWSVTLF